MKSSAGSKIPGPLVPLTVEFEGDRIGPTWLCQKCAASNEIPSDGLQLKGEEGLERYFAIGWFPVWWFCFKERYGRVFGQNSDFSGSGERDSSLRLTGGIW
jgi:hypothetical protein